MSTGFCGRTCRFERQEFDAVMFWDLADYLPEPLVKPVIERIHVGMKPGAILFSLFHTKDAGPEVPFYRYNIAAKDTLEMQPASPLQAAASLQQPPRREPVPRLQFDQVLPGTGQHSRSAGHSLGQRSQEYAWRVLRMTYGITSRQAQQLEGNHPRWRRPREHPANP